MSILLHTISNDQLIEKDIFAQIFSIWKSSSPETLAVAAWGFSDSSRWALRLSYAKCSPQKINRSVSLKESDYLPINLFVTTSSNSSPMTVWNELPPSSAAQYSFLEAIVYLFFICSDGLEQMQRLLLHGWMGSHPHFCPATQKVFDFPMCCV